MTCFAFTIQLEVKKPQKVFEPQEGKMARSFVVLFLSSSVADAAAAVVHEIQCDYF